MKCIEEIVFEDQFSYVTFIDYPGQTYKEGRRDWQVRHPLRCFTS